MGVGSVARALARRRPCLALTEPMTTSKNMLQIASGISTYPAPVGVYHTYWNLSNIALGSLCCLRPKPRPGSAERPQAEANGVVMLTEHYHAAH